MDPVVAIPVHFTLEFLGIAAAGGVAAWAAQRRVPVAAAGALVLLASQVLHTGQFVGGEEATAVLALRLAGLVLLAAGARVGFADRQGPGAPAAAAATGGAATGLGVATGVAAGAVAYGHPSMPDRRLWSAGWAGVAGADLWIAAAGAGESLLDGDLGPHILRAAGYAVVGVWAWRRAVVSLRLRIVAAFALVLAIVIVIGGGAAARVGASGRRDDEVGRLGVKARARQAAFNERADGILRRSVEISGAFSTAIGQGRDLDAVAQDVLGRLFTDLAFIAVYSPDRTLLGRAGLDPAEAIGVSGSAAITSALTGEPSAALERAPEALVPIGAAPVYRAGAPPEPQNVVAALVLGDRFGLAALEQVAQQEDAETALLALDGTPVAAVGSLADLDLPPGAFEEIAAGDVWTGDVSSGDGRFLVAMVAVERTDGSLAGGLLFATSDAVVAEAALDVSRALFGALLAAMLIAVLVAMWLSSRITRPVLVLTETARRVEAGDLQARSALDTPDEIGALAGAFDSMTATLRSTISAEQDTRRRLETIVAGMGEALVAMDDDYNVVSFNPAAEAITGVEAADAVGAKCYDVYGHRTRGRGGKPICDYVCPLRHDGGVDGGVAIETADGRTLGLAVTCSALRDAEGNLIGGVDLLRDVTPELQAERMKSSFLSNISHELRTPLAPILGYAQILLRKDVPRPKAEQYLSEIVSSVNRLERIVKILVDVSALEAGRLRIEREPIAAADIVRAAAGRWQDRSARHTVRAVAARSLPTVEGDAELLGRSLDELVDNAVKFSPEGGAVTVRAKRTSAGVELSVSDKGIGLEPEQIDELFESFVQADPSETRRFGGLGVGLSFVRRIVEGHDAELEVSSKPGRGSTFSFTLRPARTKRASGARSTGGPKRTAGTKRKAAKRSARRRGG